MISVPVRSRPLNPWLKIVVRIEEICMTSPLSSSTVLGAPPSSSVAPGHDVVGSGQPPPSAVVGVVIVVWVLMNAAVTAIRLGWWVPSVGLPSNEGTTKFWYHALVGVSSDASFEYENTPFFL